MILKKFLSYITFWKGNQNDGDASFNLKMMHRINKISILMFLIAILIMIVKFVIL